MPLSNRSATETIRELGSSRSRWAGPGFMGGLMSFRGPDRSFPSRKLIVWHSSRRNTRGDRGVIQILFRGLMPVGPVTHPPVRFSTHGYKIGDRLTFLFRALRFYDSQSDAGPFPRRCARLRGEKFEKHRIISLLSGLRPGKRLNAS